jgi:Mannosyltransferase (PIG-V)
MNDDAEFRARPPTELDRESGFVQSRLQRTVTILPKADWVVIGWTLATELLLLLFGGKAYQVLENKPLPNARAWLEIWNRWDSLHYLQVAQFGYSAKGPLKSWFYPLFPWVTRAFAFLTGDYLVAALVVSGLALMAAAVMMRRLVASDFSNPIALRAVWFFLIFPGAYFLHIGYTESLFIALAFGSILAARTDRWWLAGILGAFAWMTRAPGMILVPTLAVEAGHRLWTTRKWDWRWLWIALVPAGFCVYLLVNWHVTGDPFWFLGARRKLFAVWTEWPWHGIHALIGNMQRGPSDGEIVGTQELVFTFIAMACSVLAWMAMRPSYAMWITGNCLLVISINFIQCMPRYTLPLFPIFIFLALLAKNRFWNAVITVWSLLFLALFSSLFVRGWWAF